MFQVTEKRWEATQTVVEAAKRVNSAEAYDGCESELDDLDVALQQLEKVEVSGE